VEYGNIVEMARDRLEQFDPLKSATLFATTHPPLTRLTSMLPLKRLPFVAEADLPRAQRPVEFPPITDLPPVRGEVYLLEGCAMRVLFPRVHQATRRFRRRVGIEVREVSQGCCGALHAHNGHLRVAASMAAELAKNMSGSIPVIVNSAGCGSTMKEYADTAFASRVKDVSEFLFENGLAEALANSVGVSATATYHDACHLAHGQRITSSPRELLRAIPGLKLVDLNEADMCCGSAGIYNVLQPEMARKLVERKYANVALTGASIVATGNPGCHAWIAQAAREHGEKVRVLHTVELLEASFSGVELFE
jgi:glycolate oxidase iron-sulfur subunit